MQYPLISEYISAIKDAEDNFATLTNLRPVLDNAGVPVMSSGNFAVVFKMEDISDGKLYAVKCFTKEQEGRGVAYRLISEELKDVKSPYMVSVEYLEKELFVDTTQSYETEFPVLKMEWVKGQTLSHFLQNTKETSFELRCLPNNFLRMASWLLKQSFAHGDIKPDNIIIDESGCCVLVDYDGMYVPAMQGETKTSMGTPNFRQPSYKDQKANKDIDNYAISIIALSLQAFVLKPEMISHSMEYCIITEQGALNLHTQDIFKDEILMNDKLFQILLGMYLFVLSQNTLESAYFDSCVSEILCPKDYDYNTEISYEDLENSWIDEYGVRYSCDGRKLLEVFGRKELYEYRIREGVICIKNAAFKDCISLASVVLPNSVISIGNWAFEGCNSLTSIIIPKSVTNIGIWAFYRCWSIANVSISDSVISIGVGAFSDCKCLAEIFVPDSVKSIGGCAFSDSRILVAKRNKVYDSRENCSAIIEIESNKLVSGCDSTIIPNTVTNIGDRAFLACRNLTNIVIPESITSIGDYAFKDCSGLTNIVIPESVTSIGDDAFSGCRSLANIVIPKSVTYIGKCAFGGLESIVVSDANKVYDSRENCNAIVETASNKLILGCTLTIIPESVTSIGNYAFKDCSGLTNIVIPESVTSIGDNAFSGCSSLANIVIPESVTSIGNSAFLGCSSLANIVIPESVTSIGNSAFFGCSSLTNIVIPESVTSIGNFAFLGCSSLANIVIPESVTSIGNFAFYGCSSLTNIVIPDSITIGDGVFKYCSKDLKIIQKQTINLNS